MNARIRQESGFVFIRITYDSTRSASVVADGATRTVGTCGKQPYWGCLAAVLRCEEVVRQGMAKATEAQQMVRLDRSRNEPIEGQSLNNSETTADYDPRYLMGIAYFNGCDFFEAHEVWEELWADVQGPARRFYQGLIQSAVCLHHFGNGNTGGARKLYHGCRSYLDEYVPQFMGLNLEVFLEQLGECCAEILASEELRPAIEIVVDRIPEIHLDPPVDLPELPAELERD